jgi:putative ABC transport system substrate-binding protein
MTGEPMHRRSFLTLLGTSAAAWPLAARAQQAAVPVIGILGAASAQGFAAQVIAIRQGLREMGFVEGQNLAIEFRWAEDQFDQLPALAADLVRRQVALIITAGGTATALAAKAATSTIPIVFALGFDPVQTGVVTSLNRPGGNVTGMSAFSELLNTKRLELARELVPNSATFGFLYNPSNPFAAHLHQDALEAARTLGIDLRIFEASNAQEFPAAFRAMVEARIGVLAVGDDTVFTNGRQQLSALAAYTKIPAIYQLREFVVAGGLMSYGSSIFTQYRLAGIYSGRILKGEKPGDLPIMRPSRFELVINLKTAKALGLDVPAQVLVRADEVIE